MPTLILRILTRVTLDQSTRSVSSTGIRTWLAEYHTIAVGQIHRIPAAPASLISRGWPATSSVTDLAGDIGQALPKAAGGLEPECGFRLRLALAERPDGQRFDARFTGRASSGRSGGHLLIFGVNIARLPIILAACGEFVARFRELRAIAASGPSTHDDPFRI